MMITKNGMEPKSCHHCKNYYSGMNYNYRLKDVEHKEMDGFICAAFAYEGIMVHMSGLVNDSVDFCEEYVPRGEK